MYLRDFIDFLSTKCLDSRIKQQVAVFPNKVVCVFFFNERNRVLFSIQMSSLIIVMKPYFHSYTE